MDVIVFQKLLLKGPHLVLFEIPVKKAWMMVQKSVDRTISSCDHSILIHKLVKTAYHTGNRLMRLHGEDRALILLGCQSCEGLVQCMALVVVFLVMK